MNAKIVAKAYFPYYSNKLVLDYFTSETKKIQGVRNTSIVLTKDQEKYGQEPHES